MQRQIAALAALVFASFIFSPISAGATTQASPPIIMSTSEQSYVAGELVNIKGQIEPPVTAGHLLVMRVFSPGGEFYRQIELEIDRDGIFSWSFLPTGAAGEWRVDAQFSNKEAETTFMILEEDLFSKVVLANPMLTDIQGRKIESGNAGDNVMVTASLANDEPDVQQPFVFIVQIAGEDGEVELLSLTLGSLGPGQSADPSVSWLPDTSGTYTATIFVWSSLGSPSPLVEKQTITFAIE